MTEIRLYRKALDGLKSRYDAAKTVYRDAVIYSDVVEDRLNVAEASQKIVQEVAQALQSEAHQRISSVVSKCLASVFDRPYTLNVRFEQKRGKTEAELILVRDGVELDDPTNQVGGGVIDVAAFALRVVCLILQRPTLNRVLVFDEPFKDVRGSGYRCMVQSMLQSLSEDLGIQFIINVDHEMFPEFLTGRVVEFNHDGMCTSDGDQGSRES